MNSINTRQDLIVKTFYEIGDSFDQYAYLVELSSLLPALPPKEKTPQRLVAGCKPPVWLDLRAENGVFTMRADSSAPAVRGMLYLLTHLLSGQPCAHVADARLYFLEDTEIMSAWENSRRSGLLTLIRSIQSFASAHR